MERTGYFVHHRMMKVICKNMCPLNEDELCNYREENDFSSHLFENFGHILFIFVAFRLENDGGECYYKGYWDEYKLRNLSIGERQILDS